MPRIRLSHRDGVALFNVCGSMLGIVKLSGIVKHHGKKAGIAGLRLSPHMFRHTFAVMFLRNGGDVFSLQKIMGHATLDVLRIYINAAQAGVQEAHRHHRPADNLPYTVVKKHEEDARHEESNA